MAPIRRRVRRWRLWVAALAVLTLHTGCLPSRPHPPRLYTADEQGRLVLLLSGCRSYPELLFDDRTDAQAGQPGETVWQLERDDPEATPTRIVVGEVPDGYSETLHVPRLQERAKSSTITVMADGFEVMTGSAGHADEPGVIYRTWNTPLTTEQAEQFLSEQC